MTFTPVKLVDLPVFTVMTNTQYLNVMSARTKGEEQSIGEILAKYLEHNDKILNILKEYSVLHSGQTT